VVPREVWRLPKVQKDFNSIFVLSALSVKSSSTGSLSVMFLGRHESYLCSFPAFSLDSEYL
jgi:hypothetical protein